MKRVATHVRILAWTLLPLLAIPYLWGALIASAKAGVLEREGELTWVFPMIVLSALVAVAASFLIARTKGVRGRAPSIAAIFSVLVVSGLAGVFYVGLSICFGADSAGEPIATVTHEGSTYVLVPVTSGFQDIVTFVSLYRDKATRKNKCELVPPLASIQVVKPYRRAEIDAGKRKILVHYEDGTTDEARW